MPSAFCKRLAVGLATAAVVAVLTPHPAAADDTQPATAERIAVGREAPPFSLTGSDGETYSSSSLRGEKNLLMIFFRGTW